MEQIRYKKTEVGIIPEVWSCKSINEVCTLKHGFQFRDEHFTKSGVPVVKIGNIEDGKGIKEDNLTYVSEELAQSLKGFLLSKGHVLMALTGGTLGKVCIVNLDKPLLQNYRVGNFLPNPELEKRFLHQILTSFYLKNAVKRLVNEAAQPNFGKQDFDKLYIPVPPTLTEQKAIADALTDVDELITNLEKLIAKKKAIKQGAMQQLLTPPHKGGKRLDGFSGDWVEIDISSLAHIVGGGTPSTSNFEYWNGNINWFTPTEIGDVKYSIESFRKISSEGLKSSSARMLPKGTVLMTTRASIGDLSILDCDACTNQGFQSLVPIDKDDSEFIYYIMSTLKKSMLNLSSGSTFLEISPNKLKLLRFFIPNSIVERKAIANILKQIDDEIGLLLKRKDKLIQIKQGMMQELLTGKTRLV